MKYASMEVAKKYSSQGKLEEWVQLFLRNDGHNVALADGLLKEKRLYTGIIDFDIELLNDIKSGAPEYLTKENDKAYFFSVVDHMKDSLKGWNPPPLIIEYRGSRSFHVCDGRHRLELYRQMGNKTVPAIVWATGEANYNELLGVLKC